jgi:hypothetical protein
MKVKISKSQWETIGKKMGWKKAALEWEAENYLISISRMIENIRASDETKVRETELKTGLLDRAFNLIANFQEMVR